MHICHVELRNFRRLAATRIDFAAKTTLFVGANNSGKTSAMTALRMFLAKKGTFCLNDLPVSLWRRIDEIGRNLENAPEAESIQIDWRSILPSLDVWVHVGTSELHRVSHLLPTLDWNGEPIGVRLQLEPTSNDDFHKRYREARNASCGTIIAAKTAAAAEGKESEEYTVSLWPASMCEFLERRLGSNFSVKAYLLDPTLMVPPQNGVAKPQDVPVDREPLEADPFRGLIRIDEINAQRGFSDYQSTSTHSDGDETQGPVRAERSRLSEQLRDYYRKHLDPSERPAPSDVDALQAIHAAQKKFDEKLRSGFSGPLRELENLGYPGVNNPHIKISTRIKPTDGLSHDSAVKYEIATPSDGSVPETYGLPEQSNGLGYQNLISMIFRLIGFRDAWMRVGKAGVGTDDTNTDLNAPPPIHLVLLEEPEAHLHAQVQQVFIKKAHDVLRDHNDLRENVNLTTQLVVSTHSGHIAHETDFASMRYFRREPASGAPWAVPTSTVVNLSEVFGNEDETARFVTRYLKATHCDLFFADGAIFAEGAAERILIPHFIKGHFPELACCYLTLLEVGGSHIREPVAPVASPTTACILGDLPDGTPPPPQPPKPTFVVAAKDILTTATQQQGGRTITIRRIKPIALPPPPKPAPVQTALEQAALQEELAETGVLQPKWDFLFLGATVFRTKDSPPRTLVTYWPSITGEVSFWSSADFGLLAGMGDFAAANGQTFSMFMAWGYEDIDGSMADFQASHDRPYEAPLMPRFPDGKATFSIIGAAAADPEVLVPIQALHDIYNNEFARLKAAYEGRERAQLQREAELKANPPRPKNITLNYWRTERPAPAKRGAK